MATPRPFKRTAREPGQPLSREELSRGEVRPLAVKPEEKPAKAEPMPEKKPELKPEPKKEEPILLTEEIKEEPQRKSTTVNLKEQSKKFEQDVYAKISTSHKMITTVLTDLMKAVNEEVQVFDGLHVKAETNFDEMQKAFDECKASVGDVTAAVEKVAKLATKLAKTAMKNPSDLARPVIEDMLRDLAKSEPEKYKSIEELSATHDDIVIEFYNEMKFKFSKKNVGDPQITRFDKSYQAMLFTLKEKFDGITTKAEKNADDFETLLADMSGMLDLIEQLEKRRTELGKGKGKEKLSQEEMYKDAEYSDLLNRIKKSPFASILPADALKYPELRQDTDMAFERLASRLVIAAMFKFAAAGGFNTNAISEYNEINAEILSASEDYLIASNAEMSSVLVPAEEKVVEKAPAKSKPSWRERFMPTPEPTTAKKKDNDKKA